MKNNMLIIYENTSFGYFVVIHIFNHFVNTTFINVIFFIENMLILYIYGTLINIF